MCADIASGSDAIFGLKFLADFAKEAVAAVTGAGVGAWLGAKYAFALERSKERTEHAAALRAEANHLAEQRQVAGNLAVFTVTRMLNTLVTYKRTYDEAMKTKSPWFQLPAMRVAERDFLSFDLPSVAFLLEAKESGGALMPMKLAVEQERYAAFLETVRLRGELHQKHLVLVSERDPEFASKSFTDEELQKKVGPTAYYALRNYLTDIGWYLERNLKTLGVLLKELRALLQKELPGRYIVGFEEATLEGIDPIMAARKTAPAPPRPPSQ